LGGPSKKEGAQREDVKKEPAEREEAERAETFKKAFRVWPKEKR
jgi:hypothetical protein